MGSTIVVAVVAIVFFFISGVRIVRPTHRGLIERFGKYHRFAAPGFHWIIPGVDRMIQINTTEQMVNAEAAGRDDAQRQDHRLMGLRQSVLIPTLRTVKPPSPSFA